jgi:hypothetical protein
VPSESAQVAPAPKRQKQTSLSAFFRGPRHDSTATDSSTPSDAGAGSDSFTAAASTASAPVAGSTSVRRTSIEGCRNHAEELLTKVKQHFRAQGDNEQYTHFKQTLRKALKKLKENASTEVSITAAAREALLEIHGLFAPVALAPLALQLRPLLPRSFAVEWDTMLSS